MKPSRQRDVASIRAELARLARYDDESIVHDRWIRQRYDGGYAVSFVPARTAAVVTAWHEAGHAVAALAVVTDFRSASRRASAARFGPDRRAAEHAAWRYSEQLLTPSRLVIREVARALLVHPRPLPRDVVAAIAGPRPGGQIFAGRKPRPSGQAGVKAGMSDPQATMGPST